MAERRMFAKTIIDSDAFLDMPMSTQALYFHLSMRADDDGFINNPKRIQRMIGASEDDLKLLIAKSFIFTFESGVVVIKHWRIHNYIQKDRYKETMFLNEKKMLGIEKNNEYKLENTRCIQDVSNADAERIQDVYNMDTQDRIGKISKDKTSKDICHIDYQKIADMYNDTCVSLPRVTKITDSRKSKIKARLKTYTLEEMQKAFELAEKSDFLKGKDGGWKCNFDWLIKNDENMLKVLENNYKNNTKKGGIEINEEYRDSITDIIQFETV